MREIVVVVDTSSIEGEICAPENSRLTGYVTPGSRNLIVVRHTKRDIEFLNLRAIICIKSIDMLLRVPRAHVSNPLHIKRAQLREYLHNLRVLHVLSRETM